MPRWAIDGGGDAAPTGSETEDALYEMAMQEKDFAAVVEMQWFVTEQVGHRWGSTTAIYTTGDRKLRFARGNPCGSVWEETAIGETGEGAPP